ncbi:MAG: SEC-C domain-containing protein [Elusimicrobiaceae bacterium]|nr:SEC-C domain-containing protein [Elusimicrobiaceae bacterium]
MKEGEAIESRLMSRQIESAQRMVEGHNFDIRKHLLDYDKVMNQQRTAVYGLRNAILDGEDMTDTVLKMISEVVEEIVETHYVPRVAVKSNFEALNVTLRSLFPYAFEYNKENTRDKTTEQLVDEILQIVEKLYHERSDFFMQQGVNFAELERMLLLQIIDNAWKQNLYELDQLQNSVSLRGYAQKDPLIEYQKEAYKLYSAMMNKVRDLMVGYIFRLQLPPVRQAVSAKRQAAAQSKQEDKNQQDVSAARKIGRNDPCPCGSGKKYKKCCGAKNE